MQWGAWAAVGMAAASTAALARIQRSGMCVIQPSAGLQALQRLLCSAADDPAQVAGYLALGLPKPLTRTRLQHDLRLEMRSSGGRASHRFASEY